MKEDKEGIKKCKEKYIARKDLLIKTLKECRMQLAVKPGAGFFTLWKTPTKAFGEEIKSAEQFNFLMIEKTGTVGVHFNPYIRYAVTGDVEGMIGKIKEVFEEANVSYN